MLHFEILYDIKNPEEAARLGVDEAISLDAHHEGLKDLLGCIPIVTNASRFKNSITSRYIRG